MEIISQKQKILKIVSIIEIVFAVMGVLLGVMGLISGGVLGSDPSIAADMVGETGLTAGELGSVVAAGSLLLVISYLFDAIMGFLGLRASKDASKIMPVWYFAVIGLVLGVVGMVVNILNGGSLMGQLPSVALSAFIFWLANSIKTEAGR